MENPWVSPPQPLAIASMASSVVFINATLRINCIYRKMSVSLVLQPPSLKLERLQSILSQLNVNSDMSIDATALEKLLGKTNRS
jgi:hypothetical protein